MAKMDFNDRTLERLYRSFKWSRNNSLQIFDLAKEKELFDYTPEGIGQHSVLYQFQCLATTTDTYFRRLSGGDDVCFGVIVSEGGMILKEDIESKQVKAILKQQVVNLESLLKHFNRDDFEMNVQDIQSIINHEYLHQGQLVVMFRGLGVNLPDRFRQSFDL